MPQYNKFVFAIFAITKATRADSHEKSVDLSISSTANSSVSLHAWHPSAEFRGFRDGSFVLNKDMLQKFFSTSVTPRIEIHWAFFHIRWLFPMFDQTLKIPLARDRQIARRPKVRIIHDTLCFVLGTLEASKGSDARPLEACLASFPFEAFLFIFFLLLFI